MDIEYILKLIANNGFSLVLSIYLVYKLEFFITEIIKNQKEFSQSVTVEIKEIKKTISDLRIDFAKNQWNRWYIRFSAFLEKASYLAYTRRIYPNLMNHTSQLKISAKNTLILEYIFRGSLNSPLFAFLSLIFSLYLINTLLYLLFCHSIGQIVKLKVPLDFFLIRPREKIHILLLLLSWLKNIKAWYLRAKLR